MIPEDGTLGPVVVTRDIAGWIRAQQKYRTIFDTNPSAIGLATLEEGEFTEVNAAFLDLLGYERDEVIGATVEKLHVWARPDQRDQIVDRLRQSGSVHNVEAEFQDADGNQIDVLFSGSILELAGEPYLVGVAQDITQRKAFQRALEHRTLHDQLTEQTVRSAGRASDRRWKAPARSLVVSSLVLLLATGLGACDAVDDITGDDDDVDLAGQWDYSASDLTATVDGDVISCQLTGMVLTITNVTDNSFDGSTSSSNFSCSFRGVRDETALPPASIAATSIDGNDVRFSFDTQEWTNTGTVSGDRMSGTVDLDVPVRSIGRTVALDGEWMATRR